MTYSKSSNRESVTYSKTSKSERGWMAGGMSQWKRLMVIQGERYVKCSLEYVGSSGKFEKMNMKMKKSLLLCEWMLCGD